MEHQDWKTIILKNSNNKQDDRKSNGTNRTATPTICTESTTSSKPAWKIEKMVDDPNSKKVILYVSKKDAQAIIKARVDVGLTQKQLAQQLNMNLKDLQDIEACKAVENKQVLSRIHTFLRKK